MCVCVCVCVCVYLRSVLKIQTSDTNKCFSGPRLGKGKDNFLISCFCPWIYIQWTLGSFAVHFKPFIESHQALENAAEVGAVSALICIFNKK